MKIDIDTLSERELIELNERIVDRLRRLNKKRSKEQMLRFKIGDRVTFQPEGRRPIVGMVTRHNTKTITVITDDGQHWNVAPKYLYKAGGFESSDNPKTDIIRIRRESQN